MPTRVRRHIASRRDLVKKSALPLALLAASMAGGCATNETTTPDQRERQRAAMESYDRCLDRRLAHLADGASLGARHAAGCEGHKRDVLKTYPVHMEERVARMLDERAARRSGMRRTRPSNATTRPLIERMMELLSGG